MTWSPVKVDEDILGCERPFSFYFELIEPYWRAGDVQDAPLHRLATLARKQGAKALVVEDASAKADVVDEVNLIDAFYGGGGSAEALSFSFLSELPISKDIASVGSDALIGQCTLVNYKPPGVPDYTLTYILEAIFVTPRMPGAQRLLNNFIKSEASFDVVVWGRHFAVDGICYAQQNGVTSVCAHASIRMVERTLFPGRRAATTATVNNMLGGPAPEAGLWPEELVAMLGQITGHAIADIECKNLSPTKYVSILTAAADAGELALLIFKTGAKGGAAANSSEATVGTAPSTVPVEALVEMEETAVAGPADDDKESSIGENHVVVVFGYTRNSDEWHPLAIPEYSGLEASPYRAASMWVDHFVIHDDNFGPYLTLSTRALERDPSVRAEKILIIRRGDCTLSADVAESSASVWLSACLPIFEPEGPSNKWLDFAIGHQGAFVLRPILITRQEYLEHLNQLEGYDGSRIVPRLTSQLDDLPDLFWMVEFTLPDLFTGNRTKLGEVLVQAIWPESEKLTGKVILGARLPGQLLLAETSGGNPAVKDSSERYAAALGAVSLVSHSAMYMRKNLAPLW